MYPYEAVTVVREGVGKEFFFEMGAKSFAPIY
jgi:hypothetical protein